MPWPQIDRNTTQWSIQRLSQANIIFIVDPLQQKDSLYLPDKTDTLLDLHVWTATRFRWVICGFFLTSQRGYSKTRHLASGGKSLLVVELNWDLIRETSVTVSIARKHKCSKFCRHLGVSLPSFRQTESTKTQLSVKSQIMSEADIATL